MSADVLKLFADIKAKSTADKLKLASALIERGQEDLAEPIAQMAIDELATKRLFPGLRARD